ncbi:MAG: hypothetical protein B5766_11035 [Candidatus Lumbricidophila eiseniae]|uniref:Bax inhibitor-1/YccA family protein n=1 Tax=Candidatus Lumbricidiphila eiseniae TaxID=1969409 RepID=A0A2A6FP94_9MICO|nr:MAG: hypothetical protein B5766_11035 [Candidatus Lumbricidophila eiseniae]
MAMNNPAFTRNSAFTSAGYATPAQDTVSPQQLQDIYDRPATLPDREVMTFENTIAKTLGAFAVLLVSAAFAWATAEQFPAIVLIGGVVGLVLGLVNVFKREPSPALILAYAAAEGLFVGGISSFFEAQWAGIVAQAVIATLVVFGVTFALFASGKIRASARATKIFLIAVVGYMVFSLVNIVLMVTGATDNAWGLRGATIAGIPLGIVLGVLVVLLAAYSLVLDFDFIQKGVQNRLPKKYGWTGAFGIVMTVIWLYLEILRMLAIARD